MRQELVDKLLAKHRQQGANAVTDADIRRWLLPGADAAWIVPVPARKLFKALTPRQARTYRERIPLEGWQHWQVPFDTDPDWPAPLQDALTAYRAAWRAKMDEVNACIAANAETEALVDKPAITNGTVRVAGPFTTEGVIAREEGQDSPIGGTPDELETFSLENAGDFAVTDAEAHLDKIIRLLKASGVDFSDNKNVKLSRLEPTTSAAFIHAEGEWLNGSGAERHVAVSIGPEVGNVTAMQVENAIRDAHRKGYDDVVFAGFGFDAAAQEAIADASHPNLRLHMALINPDVAMGELLKDQPGSQLFRVFSAPRVTGPTPQDDGDSVVEVEGMDVYDPISNSLYPTDKTRIAAWFLDTDYDGRTFCICQAFFPDKTKWEKLAKALGNQGTVDPARVRRPERLSQPAVPAPGASRRRRDVEGRRQGDRSARQRGAAGSDRRRAMGMIDRIVIENFKSLRRVDLKLGRLNLLVGANGSGKSNVLDALRVLQGVGNGFTISEILDGKPEGAANARWEGIPGRQPVRFVRKHRR